MMSLILQYLPTLLQLLATSVAVPLAKAGWDFLRSHVDKTDWGKHLVELETTIESAVHDVALGDIIALVAAALANDGKIDATELGGIVSRVMDALRGHFPELIKATGDAVAGNAEMFIRGIVQRIVLKVAGTIPVPGTAKPQETLP